MPTVASAMGRGTALAAARCLGEFGATITFAGSLQSVTRTMPLQVYLARETDSDTAMAANLNFAQMQGGPDGQTGSHTGVL